MLIEFGIGFGIDIVAIIIALFFLVWSADQLVKYASSLANKLGVTPFLIGVVIIGFGTSAPELFVSGLASLEGKGGLAIGNALGSNIANIGLVLGAAACITAIPLSLRMIKVEIPLIFVSALIAIGLLFDGTLSLLDGIIMSALLVTYLVWSALSNRNNDEPEDTDEESSSLSKDIAWTIASLVILIGSSKLLVYGAVNIATAMGVSELIIGLTIIAIGTSLPELAASVAAVRQKSSSMIIGNIIGSNTFNTLGVLGLAGIVRETGVDSAVLSRDFLFLFALMALLFIFVLKNRQLDRWQGVVLICSYFGYLGYLIISGLN